MRRLLRTITAITDEQIEFFRVVSWCYDVAAVGHHCRANVQERHCELRLTLQKSDPRLECFAQQVADRSKWAVVTGE